MLERDDLCQDSCVAPNHRMPPWTRKLSNQTAVIDDIPNQLYRPRKQQEKHCNPDISKLHRKVAVVRHIFLPPYWEIMWFHKSVIGWWKLNTSLRFRRNHHIGTN